MVVNTIRRFTLGATRRIALGAIRRFTAGTAISRFNVGAAARRFALGVVAALMMTMSSCVIQPPLRLAESHDIDLTMADIETNLQVIWEIDPDWQLNWWYGWDEADIRRWGTLDYPTPTSFEVRTYHKGSEPTGDILNYNAFTTWQTSFRRKFYIGYHDLLFWSNIDSPDGTQVVIFDEKDVTNIHATTSRSRLSYAPPVSRSTEVFNSPEVFYSCNEHNFYVSNDPADYDYYDEERDIWVKMLNIKLSPMVYTYLVQVVIYNNKDRVTGLSDDASVSSLSDGVNLHTGVTSNTDIVVAYPMAMKHDLPAREGRHADIIGGRLTTFGLCGMQPWSKGRGSRYAGTRAELHNHLMVDLHFSNASDSVYTYDITKQLQSQAHGGVITIEIDADTLTIPRRGVTAAGGFNATVAPQDSLSYDFGL